MTSTTRYGERWTRALQLLLQGEAFLARPLATVAVTHQERHQALDLGELPDQQIALALLCLEHAADHGRRGTQPTQARHPRNAQRHRLHLIAASEAWHQD